MEKRKRRRRRRKYSFIKTQEKKEKAFSLRLFVENCRDEGKKKIWSVLLFDTKKHGARASWRRSAAAVHTVTAAETAAKYCGWRCSILSRSSDWITIQRNFSSESVPQPQKEAMKNEMCSRGRNILTFELTRAVIGQSGLSGGGGVCWQRRRHDPSYVSHNAAGLCLSQWWEENSHHGSKSSNTTV